MTMLRISPEKEYLYNFTPPFFPLTYDPTSISDAKKNLPYGGAGDALSRGEISDRVTSASTSILGESPTPHAFDRKDFFREMKKMAITAQSFFQKLHRACLESGIESMSSEDLWQELKLIYAVAERDVSRMRKELDPLLYTHKSYAPLPRTFVLWTDRGRVYVAIFLNRHKKAGGIEGDSPFNTTARGKKFSFGISWSLFEGAPVEKVLVASRILHVVNEHDLYRRLLPAPHLAPIYIGVNKMDDKGDIRKRVYVTPYYKAGDVINFIKKMSYEEKDVAPHIATISCLFKQIAACLACLHERGFVHRDVKPENIFQKSAREFVLGDFEFISQVSPRVPLRVVGTDLYLSPALAKAYESGGIGDVDYKAADVWALGLTMACLYIGEYPFVKPTGERIPIKNMLGRVDACISDFLNKNIYGVGLRKEIKDLIRQMLEVKDHRRITMKQVSGILNFTIVPDKST